MKKTMVFLVCVLVCLPLLGQEEEIPEWLRGITPLSQEELREILITELLEKLEDFELISISLPSLEKGQYFVHTLNLEQLRYFNDFVCGVLKYDAENIYFENNFIFPEIKELKEENAKLKNDYTILLNAAVQAIQEEMEKKKPTYIDGYTQALNDMEQLNISIPVEPMSPDMFLLRQSIEELNFQLFMLQATRDMPLLPGFYLPWWWK